MSELNNDCAGEELIQLGWRQGSMFPAASAPKPWIVLNNAGEIIQPQTNNSPSDAWSLHTEMLAPDDFLVVVSQTCDLSRSPKIEPYIEVIRAYWTAERDIIHDASRNSVRRFLLQHRTASDGKAEALIADMTIRIQIAKASLRGLAPLEHFGDSDWITFHRFQRWLGKRYNRQAIPDALVVAVQRPLIKALEKLRPANEISRTLEGIRNILFSSQNDTAPFRIGMYFICDERSGTSGLDGENLANLCKWIREALEKGGNAELTQWKLVSLKDISAYDYHYAYELPTDQYSLAQDDVTA